MTKRQVFEAVLLALSVVLVVAKAIDEVARLPELNDDTGLEV